MGNTQIADINGTQSPSIASSKLLFEETFENGKPFSTAHGIETGDWDYALNYVSKPVFRGKRAARFEIRKDQPLVQNGKRSEITVVGAVTNKHRWYSFAAYFPADGFVKDTEREVICQWHQRPDYHLGEKAASPATSLRVNKDRFVLDTGFNAEQVSTGVTEESRKKIDLGPVTKDTWHEFVFHFIHSYGPDGLVEVWHNGTKVVSQKGGNMYNSAAMPKWKIGLYKAAFKTDKSTVTRRVIYLDNIRVGNEKATYVDMAPGNEKSK
ncbi:polysaccharide lyase [Rufibacter radiotolerans]|uniref:polysaccharide lyase n=1 Tax=Rufibacter radiotolerans TaxID=1379910 RepID=UPI0018CDD229|nr:polysaccharide lyase [Rufibacter radiotolerans]